MQHALAFPLLLMLVCIVLRTSSACQTFIPIHTIYDATNQMVTIDDEYGQRDIRFRQFDVNGCQTNTAPGSVTGSIREGNDSRISRQPGSDCTLPKLANGYKFDRGVVIKLESNGWLMEPEISLYDIDSKATSGSLSAMWQEGATIVGLRDNQPVANVVQLYANSALSVADAVVAQNVLDRVYPSATEFTSNGAFFSLNTKMNCPIDATLPPSTLACAATFSFEGPVDTILVIYGLTNPPASTSNTGIVLGEMRMSCGCRCREENVGARMVTMPSGTPGECTSTTSTSSKVDCDLLGDKWCFEKETEVCSITGPALGNGNFPCNMETLPKAAVSKSFTPTANFATGGY